MDDDAENTLVRDRWVRIMVEFLAEGVWDKEYCAWDADDLPVSKELRLRLVRWSEEYKEKNPPFAGFDYFDEEASSAEGLSIARAVKRELPDWTVVFLDRAAARRCVFMKVDRSWFEYEIGLDDPSTDVGTRQDVS